MMQLLLINSPTHLVTGEWTTPVHVKLTCCSKKTRLVVKTGTSTIQAVSLINGFELTEGCTADDQVPVGRK